MQYPAPVGEFLTLLARMADWLRGPPDKLMVPAICAFALIFLLGLALAVGRGSRRSLQRARQLATLAELSDLALNADDLQKLLDLFVVKVGRATGVEVVELLELHGEHLLLRAGCGFRGAVVGSESVEVAHSWRVGRALASGKPVILRRGLGRGRLRAETLLQAQGIRSGITVPIQGRAPGYGTLGAHSRKRRRFTSEDANFLEATAALLAIAIEDRRREEEGRANQRSLAFLNDASSQLAASFDVRTVLETLARVALPFLAEFLLVDLIAEGGGLQRLLATCADPALRLRSNGAEDGTPLQVVPVANGRMGVHRARYASDATDDELQRIAADPEQLELLRRAELSSVLIVPLSTGNNVLGSLCLGARAPQSPYGSPELALASDLARRTALALDKARMCEERPCSDPRKSEFLAMLSGELRDAIALLSNTVEVLRLSETDRSESRAIEVAARQVSAMNRLVADLLDISRATRGTIELHREPVELCEFVQQFLESERSSLALRSQEVALLLPGDPQWVDADSVRLEQILATLLDHATKSNGQEVTARIYVEAQSEGKATAVRLCTECSRPLETDLAPSLGAVSTQPSEPSIDLYLVQCLAELHGGGVSVHESGAPGEREYVLRLPSIPAPRRSSTPSSGAAEEGHGMRILVVDDHQELATGLAELLERWGHEVRVAFDGPSGLEAACGFQPDLVLLDLGLPGMDGYAIAQTLRREPSLSSVEIAALTGYAHADDRRRARESGIDHYLTKPVDLAALRRVLENRGEKAHRVRTELG